MSSIKSITSLLGESNSKDGSFNDGKEPVVKMGYIKKLKTMKKKYFVIRGDSTENSVSTARIEYYDSEKKYKSNHLPKRSILLKSCFNINRRVDTKHKNVIALYTKDDCFCIVFDTEEEMFEWLKTLLSLQQGEDIVDGESPKPTFEHVWQVSVAKRGLGSLRNILGPHLLCLTDKTLSLVKYNQNEKTETYEFSLTNIRRCGDMESFFYMEVGRSSCTGAGDLWMQTEDTNIAQNMHAAILHAMSTNSDRSKHEELGPRPRNRSSSANEASKPISVLVRRQTHAGPAKPGNFYPSEDVTQSVGAGVKSPASATYSDQPPPASPATVPAHAQTNQVPSVGSLPGSFHNSHHYHHRIAVHPPVPMQRPSQRRHSVSGTTTNAGRERCDSMPSRARTTSEGHHAQPPTHTIRNVHLVPGHNRPHSMYNRGISYSPPVGSSPVSPASGACSTDSAGSSLSVDDEHNWNENEPGIFGVGRYGHSLTPDEPIIFEENIEIDENTPCTTEEKLNNYMPMDRNPGSLSLPIYNVKPSVPIKFSPNLNNSGFKSGSPSSTYFEMYSPCESSPLDTVGAYMTMSPGPGASAEMMTRYGRSASSASHSRASSLAEEGYVPMAPGTIDDGYVDHDPAHPEHFGIGEISPGNSSCSIASGTPSTDLRFSEYPLEKVSSYFTPSEEDVSAERPARAYSVGSRPNSTPKTRPELISQFECSRVRAFSVGSRAIKVGSRPLSRHVLTSTPPSGKKSSSAPLLSHSWSGSPTLKPPLYASGEPMDDLMEMDFSKNSQKSTKNRFNARKFEVLPPPAIPTTTPAHDRLSVPLNNLSISPSSTQDTSGYMDMTPSKTGEMKPVSNPIQVANKEPSSGPYLEMKPGLGGDILGRSYSVSPPHLARNILSSSPISNFLAATSSPPSRSLNIARKVSVIGSAPYVDGIGLVQQNSVSRNNDAYMDMRGPQPQHFPTTTLATHIPARPCVDTFSARKPTSPIQEEYMDMNMKQVKQNNNQANRSAPVDTPQPRMSPRQKIPSLDLNYVLPSNRVPRPLDNSEDYMNTFSTTEGRKKKDKKGSRKDKQRYSSQPITIQSTQASDPKAGSSASNSPGSSSLANLMTGRKTSMETPPKVKPGRLQLASSNSDSPNTSPYSSMRRSRTRKTNRRGSNEANTGVATPTGSTGGIFPFSLNSPGSPMKPLPGAKNSDSGYEYNRKCPVDASSGTVCISYPYPDGSSGSNPVTPDSSSSSEQPTPVNTEMLNVITKVQDTSDYVNYSPARRIIHDPSTEGDEFSEYAIMKPVASIPASRRVSNPVIGFVNKDNNILQKKLSLSAGLANKDNNNLQKKFSSSGLSSPQIINFKTLSSPASAAKVIRGSSATDATPLKASSVVPLASFRPISVNPAIPPDGSSSPKIVSSFNASKPGTSLFNRQLSSTSSASSTESGKSQDVSVKDSRGATLVSRQLSNSSVKSVSVMSENMRDDGTYENLSTCGSGGVSPVPSQTSRPGSVSCERELHYASLDLAMEAEEGARSPRNFRAQNSLTESTPSPNPGEGDTFTYAEIDFVKSESLKNCSASANRKVCHH